MSRLSSQFEWFPRSLFAQALLILTLFAVLAYGVSLASAEASRHTCHSVDHITDVAMARGAEIHILTGDAVARAAALYASLPPESDAPKATTAMLLVRRDAPSVLVFLDGEGGASGCSTMNIAPSHLAAFLNTITGEAL